MQETRKLSEVLPPMEPLTPLNTLLGKKLYILSARELETRYGPRIRFDIVSEDGQKYTLMTGPTWQRQRIVEWLAENPGEVIGPVRLRRRSRMYVFEDVIEEEEEDE